MRYLQYTYLYQLLNKQFKCFVTIFMIYLPLGSVVILNKKYLGKAFEVDDIQEVRIVITQRFVCIPDTETFYPYGGVLHPIGHIEGERVLYFTPLETVGLLLVFDFRHIFYSFT